MRVLPIVVLQPFRQSFLEVSRTAEIAPLQETPAQDAEEQFYLVQPRAVNRREVEHVSVTGIAQESAALPARFQGLGMEWQPATLRYPAANIEAPMRVQIVYDPIKPFVRGEMLSDMIEVLDPIHARTGETQIPDDLSRGDAERRKQGTRAVADVLELTLFEVTGLGGPSGILALQDLHSRLLITGENEAAFVVGTRRGEVELADVLGLGIKLRIVAVEPVDTAMRFQISLGQDAADGAAAHVAMVGVAENLEG
jgi:hypothetical protein